MPRTVPLENTHAHFTEKGMWPAGKNKMEGWDLSPDLGAPLINPDPPRTRFLHTASQNVSHTHQNPDSYTSVLTPTLTQPILRSHSKPTLILADSPVRSLSTARNPRSSPQKGPETLGRLTQLKHRKRSNPNWESAGNSQFSSVGPD